MIKREARVIGIDDGPFEKNGHAKCLVVGVVMKGGRGIDGVLSSRVDVDGEDATDVICRMIYKSKFYGQLQAVFLDGIAVAGFNVIDVREVCRILHVPVIVVMRRMPDIGSIRAALVSMGKPEKLERIKAAGQIEPVNGIFIQRHGLSMDDAEEFVRMTSVNGLIPEPLRVAHLIASGIVDGQSRGRA